MGSPERIWILISRKLTGEASETELLELQDFISQDSGLQPFMELATDMWKSKKQINLSELEQAFARHMIRMKETELRELSPEKPIWKNQSSIRESRSSNFSLGVFQNYFKVIYRNLYRFKSFSIINITGLAIGMASAILILLLVQNELSYDQFHVKKDRIYSLYNRGMHKRSHGNIRYAECTQFSLKIRISAGGGSNPSEWNWSDRSLRE